MNAARKTMQKTSPRVYTVYSICFHICTFEALACIDIESLGLQLSTKFHGRKKTRRIKIRDTTFWTCFRFWTSIFRVRPFLPFSHPFPPFSRPFPPFSVLWIFSFSMFSLVYLCSVSWQPFLSHSLPLPFGQMLQMPKSNKQFQWDSILWAMTVSLTDFSHAEVTPPVLSDLHYWDLELNFAKALRSQVLKSKQCPLSFTHPRIL